MSPKWGSYRVLRLNSLNLFNIQLIGVKEKPKGSGLLVHDDLDDKLKD